MIKAIYGDRPGIFLTCLLVWTLTNMDQALFGFAVPGMLSECAQRTNQMSENDIFPLSMTIGLMVRPR